MNKRTFTYSFMTRRTGQSPAKQMQLQFEGKDVATNFLRAGSEWKALFAHWLDCRNRHPRKSSKTRLVISASAISILAWAGTHFDFLQGLAAIIYYSH